MKWKTRLFVLLLVIAMTVTFMPAIAFADDGGGSWSVCFDGDSEYDWWHFYTVNGREEVLSVAELNISVLDEEGNTVSPEEYSLKIEHTWYDEAAGKDMYEEVGDSVGIAAKDEEGFTEYKVTVTEGSGDAATEKCSSQFMVTDKYSLNWVCADISFNGLIRKDDWRMANRFWIDSASNAVPVVKSIDGTVLTEDEYTLTYYNRVADPDAEDADRDKVLSTEKPLRSIPKYAGGYLVGVEGKAPYYGEALVLLDIGERNTLAAKGKTASIKYSKLKKKNQTLAVSKVIKFTDKGKGTKSYAKKSGNKKITINKKTGKVTVKKGLKKGTYNVKVVIKAAGNDRYTAITKTVTFKIKVK